MSPLWSTALSLYRRSRPTGPSIKALSLCPPVPESKVLCSKCGECDLGLGSHLLAFPFKAKRLQCVLKAIQRRSEEGCVPPYPSILKVPFRQRDHRQSFPSILWVHILGWAVLSAFHLPTAYSQPLPKTHIPLSASELGYPEILHRAEPIRHAVREVVHSPAQ